jgi:hypothetical protein
VERLGLLFPVGGRVAPEQMIGREGDVAELVERLDEAMHTTMSGRRRIGKTTVCHAACARLREQHGFLVVELEAPEQSTAAGFCQLLIDCSGRVDRARAVRRFGQTVRPFVEEQLKELGIPLDLSGLGAELAPATRRAALELPLGLARQHGVRVVLFIDELQRAVDYGDGVGLVCDLVDLYAGNGDVVVLVDGSAERTIEQLIGEPYGLGKLTSRVALPERIPLDQWLRPLRHRFDEAELAISEERLERILAFGDGYPYATMAAALYTAFNARRLKLGEIDDFVLDRGLEEARERLAADA